MNMSLSSLKRPRPEHSRFAVITLSIAAFIFNTTECVPVGLLPNIASSFDMDVAHTGLIMTVYAWAVTLFSLPLTMLSARFERRGLLAFLFVLFVASHVLAAFAWDFTTLLIARLGIAAAHAVFWAITIPMAVRLAPEGKKTKALSLIVTGSSLATVLGVPLGTVIGQHLGWRFTFGLIGGIAAMILLLLLMVLPRLPSTVSGNISVLPKLLKRPTLVYVYVTLALMVGAHFTAYTYVSPFLHQIGGMSNAWVVAVLFGWHRRHFGRHCVCAPIGQPSAALVGDTDGHVVIVFVGLAHGELECGQHVGIGIGLGHVHHHFGHGFAKQNFGSGT